MKFTYLLNLTPESQKKFFSDYPEWIQYYKDFEKFLSDTFEV